MLDNRSKHISSAPELESHGAPPPPDVEALVYSRVKQLWQPGDLFHNFSRFPERADTPKVDRLAQILNNGLIAPAACGDGSIKSDLNIVVIGAPIPYDSLVFLHRFGQNSGIYLGSRPGRFSVLVDPAVPVQTPQDMGPNWIITCMDEVYVHNRIPPHHLSGLVVHSTDIEEVVGNFLPRLQTLAMPVYLIDGTVVWPSGGNAR